MNGKVIFWFIMMFLPFLLYVDFWQWNTIYPIVFGWIPWHVFYQVLLNIAMVVIFACFCKYHWPKHNLKD